MEPLATALAATFNETASPTRDQVAEFMDDADSLICDVRKTAYEIVRWEPVHLNLVTFAFTVNGVLCIVDNGEGQVEAVAIAKPVSRG